MSVEVSFRPLKPSEIECRIGTIAKNGNGLSLLLYKNSRVDMAMLDEAVGPMNWKREHSRDNRNCTVSIWDDEKREWVGKEDTGTESNTEAEKGLASDSFKRACVNWGIGRELYTAPFIWIPKELCHIKQDGNGRFRCYDRFSVTNIHYDGDGVIDGLAIKDEGGVLVYMLNNIQKEED